MHACTACFMQGTYAAGCTTCCSVNDASCLALALLHAKTVLAFALCSSPLLTGRLQRLLVPRARSAWVLACIHMQCLALCNSSRDPALGTCLCRPRCSQEVLHCQIMTCQIMTCWSVRMYILNFWFDSIHLQKTLIQPARE